jgi:DNA modification methylase
VSVRLLIGDCRDRLRELPDQSVQCVVTSPPYFGLRDYGVEGQMGAEASPKKYARAMAEVFREVWRVLRDDGTVWLNLGDSYAGSWGAQGRSGSMADRSVVSAREIEAHPKGQSHTGSTKDSDYKPKDLMGIPWRVAFALQDDGWYLRQDIVWHKPNPMPESVTDRCTKSHEYIFMLTKSPRYYFDAEAIKESQTASTKARLSQPKIGQQSGSYRQPGKTNGPMNAVGGRADSRNKRSVWTIATRPYKGACFATFPPELVEPCILAGAPRGAMVLDPFAGSGTTGYVADYLQRDATLMELNPQYADLVRECLAYTGMFNPLEVA